MQVAQSGNSQNIELVGRLNVGGRWYGRGQVVAVDSADAAVLTGRGIATKAKPGAKPVNVEIVKPSQLPVQTKAEEEPAGWGVKDQDNAQRPAKKR